MALARLRGEYDAEGKAELFATLKPLLEEDSDADTQRAMATRCGMSEGALRVAVFRLRRRYRALLFAEVAQGLDVTTEEEVRQELSHLISAL
jgi:RNA polymerase sigma-70 factor (ECF subfamily)